MAKSSSEPDRRQHSQNPPPTTDNATNMPRKQRGTTAQDASFTYTWYCERDLTRKDCRKDMLEQLCSAFMLLSTGHLDPVLWGTRRTHLSISNVRRAEKLRTPSRNIPHWKNHPQTQNIGGSTLIRPTQTLSL